MIKSSPSPSSSSNSSFTFGFSRFSSKPKWFWKDCAYGFKFLQGSSKWVKSRFSLNLARFQLGVRTLVAS
ncbi:hypothetical protein L6452_38048 [Arctium lappa]|uniref:Uncharacterized protein n=1 Tax=Arctium lappa TaxID=4217 RepID=A0ACB8Y4Q4_ARCLA|nr:hypothetical protein L6452_38048 [Arctium lappa]